MWQGYSCGHVNCPVPCALLSSAPVAAPAALDNPPAAPSRCPQLADEPTGDLDSANSDLVMKLLTDLNRLYGLTIVMVTHDVGMKVLAHRVLHMVDGKIIREEKIDPSVRAAAIRGLESRIPPESADIIAAAVAEAGSSGAGSRSAGAGITPMSEVITEEPDSSKVKGGVGPARAAAGPAAAAIKQSVRQPADYDTWNFTSTQRSQIRHPVLGRVDVASMSGTPTAAVSGVSGRARTMDSDKSHANPASSTSSGQAAGPVSAEEA